jgi:hypothetical protein
LNISYTGVIWADLVDCIYRQLITKPEWRRSVVGLGAESSNFAKRQNIVPELLSELRTLLANQNFVQALCEDLLAGTKR